ncbi:MAG: transposase [Spirochaetes bacterium]|nr:transposase [Spirochaetota bacterium]
MKNLPVRKPNRLKNYDYSSAGLYFITICVKNKYEIFGHAVGAITNRPQSSINRPQLKHNTQSSSEPPQSSHSHPQNEMEDNLYVKFSEYGIIVDKAINEISVHYKNVSVDRYVIMPNHIHLILIIQNNEADGRLITAPTSVSIIVKQFKQYVSKQLGFSPWQKSYHDHIIRNQDEYNRITEYIENNPTKWISDCYYKRRWKK